MTWYHLTVSIAGRLLFNHFLARINKKLGLILSLANEEDIARAVLSGSGSTSFSIVNPALAISVTISPIGL